MASIDPKMLEGFLIPTSRWLEAPLDAHLLANREAATGVTTGIAHHPELGWFVLQSNEEGPYCIWADQSDRTPVRTDIPVRNYPGFTGPIRIPAEAFEELEPVRRESDGRLLKRMRLKALGPQGPILVEDPMDQTFVIGPIDIQPMPMPTGGIFYMNFDFPKIGDDK